MQKTKQKNIQLVFKEAHDGVPYVEAQFSVEEEESCWLLPVC